MSSRLTIVVYGPTQFGKSTFIKRIGGNLHESALGREDGFSVTKTPNIYEFTVTWPGESVPQTITAIDLPGLDDTELQFSNSFIGDSIKLAMSQRQIKQIDAFLVFDSLAESCTQIQRTSKQLINALPTAGSSIVVVLSKADLAESAAADIRHSAIEDCTNLNFPFVEWSDKCDEIRMETQMVTLRAAISAVNSFLSESISEFELGVERLADMLQESDPDRYETKTATVPVSGVTTSEEQKEFTITELVKKYSTRAEIEAAAEEMQHRAPRDYPRVDVVMKKETITRRVPEKRSWKCGMISKLSTKMKEVSENILVPETRITFIERPLYFFIEIAERETVMVQKKETKIVQNLEIMTKKEAVEVQTERYPKAHYLEKARKQIIQEVWEQMKAVAKNTKNFG